MRANVSVDPRQRLARLLDNGSLAEAEIDRVCSHCQVERFRKETRIVTQGRPYGKLVYVAEGILRVFVVTPGGDEVVKNFVEANDSFADLECLEKCRPAVVSLAAITSATELTLSKVDSARLVKAFPAWEQLMCAGPNAPGVGRCDPTSRRRGSFHPPPGPVG